MEFCENVALAPYTTLGIGGPARWFAEAASESDVLEAVRWAREQTLPLFVLGGGSNLLVSDAGFPGLALRVMLKGIAAVGDGVYHTAAGEDWDKFVERTVIDGSAGIECLAGIPGTVGGTPVQNVGAYGQEVAETIERVRVLDLETLACHEMSSAECGFAYRTSVFNSTARGKFLVLRVDYRLRPSGVANLRYADLQKVFPTQAKPALTEVAAAVRRIRQSKGMLLVAGDPDCRSAGSFFKNPVIPERDMSEITARIGTRPPSWPAGEGFVKLPAAWLVEQAGFRKGFTLGLAGISSRHSLALVNRGGATASDLLALRDAIVAGVREKFGIELQMEPVLVGL
jgi:UDP-N-acetylmuramate dehydrogenase